MAEIIAVTVVCDCHDDVQTEEDRKNYIRSEVMSFSVDGKNYEFDGCAPCCARFREQMAKWIKWSRLHGKARLRIVEKATPPRSRTPEIGGRGEWWTTPRDANFEERNKWQTMRADMRIFANGNGWQVGERGRIPADAAAAYAKHARGKTALAGTAGTLFREGTS